MTKISGLYWHVHHDKLVEWCYDYEARREYIEREKPEGEHALRLQLFRPVTGTLNPTLEQLRTTTMTYNDASTAYTAAYYACQADAAHAVAYAASAAAYAANAAAYAASAADYAANTAPEVLTLHTIQCPNCPWDGRTIFIGVPAP